MDMAVKTFDHVEGFFMYYVPGITFLEERIEAARQRWQITIHELPHWSALMAIKYGVYRHPEIGASELPSIGFANVMASMIKLTGIPIVLTGMKRADSMSRRGIMAGMAANGQVFHPLQAWNKADVVGYLASRGIPLPLSSGGITTGVDLSDRELLWLHDTYPDDFRVLLEYFPFAMATVKRREFYGDVSPRTRVSRL